MTTSNRECFKRYFFDYHDLDISLMPQKILDLFGYLILAAGAACWYFEIKYEPWKVMVCAFVANICLHVPSLYIV